MTLRKRDFIALLGGAALWPFAARAEPSEQMRRVGVLIPYKEEDKELQAEVAAFQDQLGNLGWKEGRNLRIDYRWAAGQVEKIREFAKELVALQPDVIVSHTTPVTAALLHETRTIPIVFLNVSDPLGPGFVASFARPGGNVTGFSNFEFSTAGKWLELLKEVSPGLSRFALMFNPKTAPYAHLYLDSAKQAAPLLNVAAAPAPVENRADIENVIKELADEPKGGLVVVPDASTTENRAAIIALAARYRVPAVYPARFFAADGGLTSYGIDVVDMNRRVAIYVDRLLRGEKPGVLPVQAPVKFTLVINRKSAVALGLDLPPTLFARADEVIE
jgi:putative ABC transport system substrate-binding protein